MTRRGRFLVITLLASLALGATACASPVDPISEACGGTQSSGTNVCFTASGTQSSGT